MEKQVIVVCSVVGFLALLSAATAFAAEATRLKGDHGQISISSYPCDYPTGPAFGLGLTSAMSLFIAEMTIFASWCTWCFSKGPHREKPNWSLLAIVCGVVSWIGCFIAFLVLLQYAFLHFGYVSMRFGVCIAAKPGALAGAGALAFVSLMLGLVYYLMLTGEKKPLLNPIEVALGRPQFPSPAIARDPVSAQEDVQLQRESV